MDKVVKNAEFSFGIRRMKAACMATGVEGGKHVIREQISTGKLIPGESTVLEHTQAMHAEVKSFLETYSASYLRLGEFDMKGLCQLFSDSDAEERRLLGSTSRVRSSFTPPGV